MRTDEIARGTVAGSRIGEGIERVTDTGAGTPNDTEAGKRIETTIRKAIVRGTVNRIADGTETA